MEPMALASPFVFGIGGVVGNPCPRMGAGVTMAHGLPLTMTWHLPFSSQSVVKMAIASALLILRRGGGHGCHPHPTFIRKR